MGFAHSVFFQTNSPIHGAVAAIMGEKLSVVKLGKKALLELSIRPYYSQNWDDKEDGKTDMINRGILPICADDIPKMASRVS